MLVLYEVNATKLLMQQRTDLLSQALPVGTEKEDFPKGERHPPDLLAEPGSESKGLV